MYDSVPSSSTVLDPLGGGARPAESEGRRADELDATTEADAADEVDVPGDELDDEHAITPETRAKSANDERRNALARRREVTRSRLRR
jgi:hypothetical protein